LVTPSMPAIGVVLSEFDFALCVLFTAIRTLLNIREVNAFRGYWLCLSACYSSETFEKI